MKKLAMAVAVFGLSSGAALAQSNVTIYGVADAGIVYEGAAPAGSVTRVSSGIASGSRLGFKGKEDLGNGLSAHFVIENGYSIDTGAAGQGGLVFGRQAVVGLSGGFGTVSLGRQYSPFYKVLRDVADPFEIGLAGTATNVIAGYTRVDNMAEYVSPSLAGFTVDLAYGAGETAGDNAYNRSTGATLSYTLQGLTVALSQHRKENATATDHVRSTMLVVKYNIGAYTLNVAQVDTAGLAGADSKDTLLGGSVTLGNDKVLASYILHDASGANNRDARQWALGYFHTLSKRSDLYAGYGRISNRNGATFTVGNATDTGTGRTGFNLGMRHRF